jgi:hypothetical protein
MEKITIDVAFEINEKVKVGNAIGTVYGYYVNNDFIEYHVSIWDGSRRETFYFRESELEKFHEPKPIAFAKETPVQEIKNDTKESRK